MRIDRIDAYIVGNPWKNWVLVKVATDQGHVGWGEATTGLTTMPAFSAVGTESSRSSTIASAPRRCARSTNFGTLTGRIKEERRARAIVMPELPTPGARRPHRRRWLRSASR